MTEKTDDPIFTKSFWIEKWQQGTEGEGNDTLKVGKGFSTPGYWDRAAQSYDKNENELLSRKAEKTVKLFKTVHGPLEGCTVLDIGCGTGFLARHLALQGCLVTGLDFSGKMIERAKQDLPGNLENRVEFHTMDWNLIDLEKSGWTGGFDIVIAFMSPAVSTPGPFFKMIQASKKTCAIRGWAEKRKHVILDNLWEIIMGKPLKDKPRNFLYKINLLFSMGCFPEITFDRVQWEEPVPVKEELNSQLSFFKTVSDKPQKELERIIRDHLSRISENGTITREHKGITGTALWQKARDRGIRKQPT